MHPPFLNQGDKVSIAQKLADQKKLTIVVEGVTFSARRATVEEFARYATERVSDAEVARVHVTGWDGVKESDLLDDGGKDAVPYDRALFEQAIGDKPDWYSVIAAQVMDHAIKYLKNKAENEKK